MSLTCSPRAPDPVLAGHPQTRAPQKGVTAKLVPTVYLQLDGFRKKKMSNSLNLDANLEPGKIFQIDPLSETCPQKNRTPQLANWLA